MTRAEHMEWSKSRAKEILDSGDIHGAYASMVSDMGKHDETAGHIGIGLGIAMLMAGHLSSRQQMAEFIDGFN